MAGDQEVVQYRGHIMPVFRIATLLGSETKSTVSSGCLQVVVYTENGHSVGLVIDRILDIVEEPFQIQPDTGRPGVLGAAVIQQRTTEVLDLPALLTMATSGEASIAAHA